MKKQFFKLIFFLGFLINPTFTQAQDTTLAASYLVEAQQRIDSLKYEKAMDLCEKAIQIYESIDAQYYQLGYAYNIKGDAYYEAGQYDKARAYFLNAKDILWYYYDNPHLEIAQSFNFLGLCYWKQGALERAADSFKEGLEMRILLLGEKHSKVADSYNNLGNIALDQRDLTKALAFYQKSLTIRKQVLGATHLDVASSYNNIGTCFSYAGQYQNAIEYYQQSLVIRKEQLEGEHPKIAQNYLNMGDCYFQKGQLEESLSYYYRSLEILQKHFEPNHLDIGNVYNNLGNCYSQLGQNAKALTLYEKAKSIQLTHYQQDNPNLISVYNNLANVFDKQGDYQKAMVYYENNLHILRTNPSFGDKHPYTAFTHNNLGLSQTKMGNYKAALSNYSLAFTIYSSEKDKEQIAETLNNIGTCFLEQENYQKAIFNFKKSLTLFEEIAENNATSQAVIYQNLGNCYANQQQYDLSLKHYQKALDLVQPNGNINPILVEYKTSIGLKLQKQGKLPEAIQAFQSALSLLKIDSLVGESPDFIDAPIGILNLLNAKAGCHLSIFQKNKQIAELQKALSTFDYAVAITQKLRQQYQEVQSKRMLGKISYKSYEGAIHSCYQLFEQTSVDSFLEKAFYYSEQSRSNLVLEALNISAATSFSGIPDNLLKQENELKTSITFYEKKKRAEVLKGINTNQEALGNYNNKIFKQKQVYQQLIQEFESKYLQYFQLKYATNPPSIKKIQTDLLTADHSFIEYFIADTSVYVFVINPNSVTLQEISIDSLLEKVSIFRMNIYKYYLNAHDQTGDAYLNSLEQYAQTAYYLYQKLIQPIQKQLAEKITIINGGVLNYLPFEALLVNPPNAIHQPKSFDYLLKHYEICYGYSATLLHRNTVKKSSGFTKTLLAFAPEFSKNDRRKLVPLSHNIPEVKRIQSLIKSDIFIEKEATKQQFIALAPQYQIIHVSSHGKSNADFGDYSYLAFAENSDSTMEDLLYAKDVYNLSLNADLVVLSACETGQGEFLRSEGPVSLGRAFFYSGAKSILNTLWSVDDASTGQLISHFYQGIREHSSKSAALRNAKLSLIEDGEYAHPFYWSAFMLIGDRDAIELGGHTNWQLLFGVLVISIIGYLFFKKVILKFISK